jgi:hypothetical protein
MRDHKGNLQLLPDEEELQKPKKPLTPYMLFVREVFTHSMNNVFILDQAASGNSPS